MWSYSQGKGSMYYVDEKNLVIFAGHGYSGIGEGFNNPLAQDVHRVGPLPRGSYIIGDPVDTEEHGPFFLPLTPDPTNQMFGRSGLGIHGDRKDNQQHPHQASCGCIVIDKIVRWAIHGSRDRGLLVTV